ncbi:hypothetical protein AJ78_03034 [Emergomyces pasteurianus Ep9510]|uniref:Methyltransferase type 12 domain-containing protein n=1 Tax=Emergomyces pasteurianus Ep9510 TaxID=1447872 RepID=A0A1J9QLS8_9EURO|nr:hypothetical protein AJ78_03034 [Emergomyces pasteurianus Ep9510]
MVRWAGGLIDPAIPKNDIKRVADVATGTGDWLIDTAKELNNPTNVYKGFDISAAQFPSDLPKGIGSFEFVQHNVLERFPAEFHSQFDLINIRLVVQAFKAAEIPRVISNLIEILRPGGYLQWGDLLWASVEAIPPQEDVGKVLELIRKHMIFHGVPFDLPTLVESTMREAGMQDIILTTKLPADGVPPLSLRDVTDRARPAFLFMLPKVLETQTLSENKTIDAAVIEAQRAEIAARFEQALDNGNNLYVVYCVVVGKKTLE